MIEQESLDSIPNTTKTKQSNKRRLGNFWASTPALTSLSLASKEALGIGLTVGT